MQDNNTPAIKPQNNPSVIVKGNNYTGVALVGLLLSIGAYQVLIKPFLEKTGLKDSAEDKADKKIIENTQKLSLTNDYWNPNFHTLVRDGIKSVFLLTKVQAIEQCKKLKNAQGRFNDDEEAIYRVFRSLQYKTQVSFLVKQFADTYNLDLYLWLRDVVFNEEEMATLLNITQKLKQGFRLTNNNII
jgi:hypothetical protein